MNANRLVNMAMRLFMRHGVKWLSSKAGASDATAKANTKRAGQAARIARRANRF